MIMSRTVSSESYTSPIVFIPGLTCPTSNRVGSFSSLLSVSVMVMVCGSGWVIVVSSLRKMRCSFVSSWYVYGVLGFVTGSG